MEFTERVKVIIQNKIRDAYILAAVVAIVAFVVGVKMDEGGFVVIIAGLIIAYAIVEAAKNSVARLGMMAEMSDNIYAILKSTGGVNRNQTSSPSTNAYSSSNKPSNSRSYSLSKIAAGGENNGQIRTWRCEECGEENPASSRVCKGCGYQK
ncbi:MAG: hypothetical protein K2N72_01015 [Oscillospiraceae bacterium]|nr:hypothetical protein [Oscillospiraceae bacterium]